MLVIELASSEHHAWKSSETHTSWLTQCQKTIHIDLFEDEVRINRERQGEWNTPKEVAGLASNSDLLNSDAIIITHSTSCEWAQLYLKVFC